MRTSSGSVRSNERLGVDGALELELRPHVVDGGMPLSSTRLARVTVDELADDGEVPSGQRVDVRVRMPVLGEVFRYSGAVTYRIAPDTATGVAASDPVPTLSMWLTENSPT
ncbi:hypothetical protein [Microbacterium dauci]|uniref:Uncharacterized protein n=1 Tax=Microbacterium dauci TaxID=3048008 RepID=A0ABT6ZBZ2_9MICO|nr:hypothetical protein [Microbacterium sp. LX3-4]MDJ1113663.1 hypothetical protein [Microbacterium sp. LX3-4]